MTHARTSSKPMMITDGVITVPNICGGSDAAQQAASQVSTDPASGFPDARPGEQHHSSQQPRNEAGQFTQAEIDARLEAARTEERDKLYQRMEKEKTGRQEAESRFESLQGEVNSIKEMLAQQQEFFQQTLAPVLQQQAPAEPPQATFEQGVPNDGPQVDAIAAKFEEEMRAMQTNLSKIEQERDAERALREREQELAALESYRQQVIADNQNEVAPELMGFIKGYTQEEIDASLEAAKTASGQIMSAFQEAQQAQMQQGVANRSAMPTVSPGAPSGVISPLDNVGTTRELSAAEIKAMPMSEFAKIRGQLIRPNRGQGMYG